MTLLIILIYLFIGAFAGLMAGVLGVGGGIIVVPGLAFIFQQQQIIPLHLTMYVAAGSSLMVMIFTSLAALKTHHKLGNILWPIYNKLWPGLIAGVICGAFLSGLISKRGLECLFAFFIIFVALKMLSDVHVNHAVKNPGTWLNRLISYFIGLISGLLGVGGGVLIIPYLTYCGIDGRKIAPVSNLCTFTVGLVGALAFMVNGAHNMSLIPYSTGYVYWPAVAMVGLSSSFMAPIGAKLNYILPMKQLKFTFVLILFITAIEMLF